MDIKTVIRGLQRMAGISYEQEIQRKLIQFKKEWAEIKKHGLD